MALFHDTSVNIIIPEGYDQEKIHVLWLLYGMPGGSKPWGRWSIL